MRLVNEAVPAAKLRERTVELAKVLMGKNPTVMRGTKMAVRLVQQMAWEVSDDYLMAKNSEALFLDPERGRGEALKQFLDDKSYKPGRGGYAREEQK